MNTRCRASILSLICLLLPGSKALSQQDWDSVEIRTIPIRGGVQMMTAAGGNLAVFGGPGGVLVVDADYAELSSRILSAIREATAPDSDLRFLVNTHWHFDHTSGNGFFAQAGAVIISHESVDQLLAEDQVMHALEGREVPAVPEMARPVVTFNDRMSLSLNGDLIHLVHMPDAHTNGDIIVHFRDADVIHLGDLFFNGMYPFIDVDHGGNLSGIVGALEEVLEHSGDTTLFIPGHGPLADRATLEEYALMLRTVRDRVQELINSGKSRDEVVAEKPTSDLDAVWGGHGGFTEPDRWVGLVYDGMVQKGR